MIKYLVLLLLFTLICLIGFNNDMQPAIFVGALICGYSLSKIQHKYFKKYRFRDNSIYTYIGGKRFFKRFQNW